jgi:hypothetical protein
MVLAGSRRPQRDEGGLVVDYADVLRQAVENERFRVLREVRERVGKIATTKENARSYSRDDRTANDFKREVLREIDYIEESR